MDSLALTTAVVADADADVASSAAVGLAPEVDAEPRTSVVPRSRSRVVQRSGMSFGHDVLLALIMAVAMAATVFLYR